RRIKVDMGTVTFVSHEIPVSGERREVVDEKLPVGDEEFKVTCASVGNPHCVIPMPEISKELALKLGPQVETHPLFPNKINVQLLKVVDRRNIRIEIWERGAGYTLASGSSSCAAASAAHKLGHVDRDLTVHSPGGQIEIEIKSDGHIFMTGGVTGVMSGNFKKDLQEELGMST
ncbi:MAG: diaminopimelate epimerase, partial [Candidatus Poribacteria bacterium]|nr:diaminopimelate epimerase [Candidatus Poribacteria bacterium]